MKLQVLVNVSGLPRYSILGDAHTRKLCVQVGLLSTQLIRYDIRN